MWHRINMCTFGSSLLLACLLPVVVICQQQNLQTCRCVEKNRCYQPIPVSGEGDLNIRIVNPGGSTNTTTTPITPATTSTPVTTSSPVVTTSSPPMTCTSDRDLCCSGPSVTGCGLRYNITPTATTTPTGGQAQYGSSPWQAAVLNNLLYLGGGVLINASTVLTAAHKVANLTATSLRVRFGAWNLINNTEPFPVVNSLVSQIFVHPNYNHSQGNLFSDVAILRLTAPVTLDIRRNPAVNTACLPTATTNFDNMRCLVAGWGKDSFYGNYQSVIKEVEVPIIPSNVCQDRLQTTRLGNIFQLNATSFICAGSEPARDACVGDGGSALVCNIGGRYQVAGLVAWGIGCANGNVPGVYVRVTSFLPFINQYTI